MNDDGPDGQTPSAGWYPDPQAPGRQRWWDGSAWTEHTAPLTAASSGPSGAWPAGGPVGGAVGAASAIPADQVPDTWLWQSIVATVICCMPFGIAGIVFSSQAQTAINLGNLAEAQQKAQQAKTFTLVSAGLGAIPWALGIGWFLFVVLFGFGSAMTGY